MADGPISVSEAARGEMSPTEAGNSARPLEAPHPAARLEPSDARAWLRMALDAPKLLPFVPASPAQRVRHWARRRPDALAIAFEDRRLGWREVDREADRWARWLLGEGVGRGDVVAVMMDNRPEFLIAFTAISRIGAVAALINTQVKGAGLEHALGISGARLTIGGSEHAAALVEASMKLPGFVPDKQLVVQRDPASEAGGGALRVVDDELDGRADPQPVPDARLRNSDLCCYVYTSGTTGLPKAAVIRNQRMLGGGFTFGHLMHRARPGDLIYVALPLYHSSALFLGWGSALATGAAIGLRRRFSASVFWADVERWRATSFLYIGELCRYLLDSPERPEERRHVLRAAVGNGMRPDLWLPFQERFAIPVVREFYGATEGNAPLLNVSGRPGMIGRMASGQAVVRCDAATGEPERGPDGFCQRVEPGETGLLLGRISRALTFDGYVDGKETEKKIRTDVFARGDRYFDTGDLVRLWQGGWLSFADRVGDTFRWKGENVSTLEVAAALDRAEGVRDAIVFGVEIPGTEGRACMAVLRLDGPPDFDALSAHFVRELAPYQRPLFVRLLREAPRTTGTFKQQTASYRDEGFDPSRVEDEIWVSRNGRFERCDADTYRAIRDGTFVPS
jgi:acyl-CoA synthetase (AMP-forming)/AMP-acid ligase II